MWETPSNKLKDSLVVKRTRSKSQNEEHSPSQKPARTASQRRANDGWFEKRHQDIFSFEKLAAFWAPTLSLVAYQLSIGLPFVICGVMIGLLGDSFSLAVFGLACTYLNILLYSILNGITENLGVNCSTLFGRGDYAKMNAFFWKSLLSVFFLFLLFVLSTYYAYEMLAAIDVLPDVAYSTGILLRASIPYIFFQALNNTLVSYLASQQITQHLAYVNGLSIVVVFFAARYFIFEMNYKEIGFAYTKLIQEFLNTICYIYLLVKFGKRESLAVPTVATICTGYLSYLRNLGITVLSFYGEFIGFEANTYFAALLHDISELALWSTLVNFSGIIFFISLGFSNSFRTFLGETIGKRQYMRARTDSQHYLIYLGLFSMATILLLAAFKYEVGYMYTGDEALSVRMADILVVYTINVFPTLAFYSVCSIYRLLDYEGYLFRLTTVIYPAMVVVSSYFFCFPLGLKVYGINWGFSLSKAVIIVYMIWKLYTDIDWSSHAQSKDLAKGESREELLEQ